MHVLKDLANLFLNILTNAQECYALCKETLNKPMSSCVTIAGDKGVDNFGRDDSTAGSGSHPYRLWTRFYSCRNCKPLQFSIQMSNMWCTYRNISDEESDQLVIECMVKLWNLIEMLFTIDGTDEPITAYGYSLVVVSLIVDTGGLFDYFFFSTSLLQTTTKIFLLVVNRALHWQEIPASLRNSLTFHHPVRADWLWRLC